MLIRNVCKSCQRKAKQSQRKYEKNVRRTDSLECAKSTAVRSWVLPCGRSGKPDRACTSTRPLIFEMVRTLGAYKVRKKRMEYCL